MSIARVAKEKGLANTKISKILANNFIIMNVVRNLEIPKIYF